MSLLPSGDSSVANSLTHPNTTSAQQKTNWTNLRAFLSDLLGTDSGDKKGARTALGVGQPLGQCRLAKSGANLVLSRYQGRYLTINGDNYEIPAAGVSLAPTALGVSVVYYIYAYMNAGVMTLEASATGHATDATTGVEIKSADATRTLVGMARTIAGPAWQDTFLQRFVLSWFNQRPLNGIGTFSADRTTTSASFVELNTEIRNEFLTWAGNVVDMATDGRVANSALNQVTNCSIAVDGATPLDAWGVFQAYNAGAVGSIACRAISTGLAEGYHYATLVGSTTAASTGTWSGSGTAGARFSLKSTVMG